MLSIGRLTLSLLLTSLYQEKKFGGEKSRRKTALSFFDGPEEIEFREQGPSLHHFCSSNIRMEKMFLQHCREECIVSGIKIPATKIHDYTGKRISSNFCLSSHKEIDEECHNGEEYMEQNLPVQDK